MSLREQALKAMSGEDASLRSTLLRTAMGVAEPLYRMGVSTSVAGYRVGVSRSYPLGRPTVCVGNLTTGGTGKTPMVGYVVRHLAGLGHKPCILLRGYRGGDEAEEHKQLLGDLAYVEPNPDRVGAARLALADHDDITCFVLDDGFQHLRAKRDLDLVLIDATNPWGYGHMLPRGLMREPKSALRRADGVIVTRSDQVDTSAIARLDEEIRQITDTPPIAHAEHAWAGLRDANNNTLPLSTIEQAEVMGVVGIGNPTAFANTLTKHAGNVLHCESLPDHHGYTRPELMRLIDLAVTANAKAIVTTEKDWVKWSVLLEDDTIDMPIYRVDLNMRLIDDEDALKALLTSRLPAPADAGA